MAIGISQNMDYRGAQPNFSRDQVTMLPTNLYALDNYDVGHKIYLTQDMTLEDGTVFKAGVYMFCKDSKGINDYDRWAFQENEEGNVVTDNIANGENVLVLDGNWDNPPNYFWVENIYDGENTLTLNSQFGMTNVEYTDNPNNTWKKVVFSSLQKNINIPKNGKVYLRGTNQTLSKTFNRNYPIIYCPYSFNAGGDLTTLLEPEGNILDLTGRSDTFSYLFCMSKIVDASKLILPSTVLVDTCYCFMFNGCTSLTTAPKLPATTLANYCYAGMFYGCSSLNKVTALFTDNNAEGCLLEWLVNTSSGTFYHNPDITPEALSASQIPSGWTKTPYTT